VQPSLTYLSFCATNTIPVAPTLQYPLYSELPLFLALIDIKKTIQKGMIDIKLKQFPSIGDS